MVKITIITKRRSGEQDVDLQIKNQKPKSMLHCNYIAKGGLQMSHVIRISSEVYSRLGRYAQGFDTPANVIERLLDLVEGKEDLLGEGNGQALSEQEQHSSGRDTTKYKFNGEIHNKRRLVLAVVQQYVAEHPKVTFDELAVAFPKNIQGSKGVFNELSSVTGGRDPDKRHFIGDTEIVQLSDASVAVCTQWGVGNINAFVKRAGELGYTIEPTQ